MNPKIKLLLPALLIFVLRCYSQTPTFDKISITSPNASALQKFTDYPVSLNTGLIDISIPIYTININGIKVPIDLKYHASGIKYDDYCNNMGIGWTLEAGGMLTEVVQGIKDYDGGLPGKYIKDASLINPLPGPESDGGVVGGENAQLMNFDKGYGDGEHDIYNFTFPGHSGKFFYPGAVNSEPVISPYKKLLITGKYSSNMFTITDEAGIKYAFGQPEGDFNLTGTENHLLTEIISADKSDTVRFTYTVYNFSQAKWIIAD